MTDRVREFLREHVRCMGCDGFGEVVIDASNANETHVDTRDCEVCDGSGIDPDALRDLRALVEAEYERGRKAGYNDCLRSREHDEWLDDHR